MPARTRSPSAASSSSSAASSSASASKPRSSSLQSNEGSSSAESQGSQDEEAAKLNMTGGAKFSAALRALTADAAPAPLLQRKTKMMKQMEAELHEKQREKRVSVERKAFDNKCVRPLPESDPGLINRERDLKRVATRGVVALFNAIGTHQIGLKANGTGAEPVPKEQFLEMLKHETAKSGGALASNNLVAPRAKSGAGWKALQEDYMLGDDVDLSEDDDQQQQQYGVEALDENAEVESE